MKLKEKTMALLKKKSLPANADVHQEIINAAGMIYNYLLENGEVTNRALEKDLDLYENLTDMGLGWLSREDKIEYTPRAKSFLIKLK